MSTSQMAPSTAAQRSDVQHGIEIAIEAIQPHPRNYNTHPETQIDELRLSLRRWGQVRSIVVQQGAPGKYLAVAGHGLTEAAKLESLPTLYADVIPADWTDEQVLGYLVADNRLGLHSIQDEVMLAEILRAQEQSGYDLRGLGVTGAEYATMLAALAGGGNADGEGGPGAGGGTEPTPTLADRFVVPPFSILDGRQGYWRERKQQWLALGIRSDAGRAEGLMFQSDSGNDPSYYDKKRLVEQRLGRTLSTSEFQEKYYDGPPTGGTSVFDPVLCELAYRWFAPRNGVVLDPFAGGSVRGLVAALLGLNYVGVDLRPEQVEANQNQAETILARRNNDTIGSCRWVPGDSRNIPELLDPSFRADFVFTCPPYFDLEVYSDNPADLSRADDYQVFLAGYREILLRACEKLKNHRFACIVVGDIRDPRTGLYRNFVADTISAMRDAGLSYYNEGIFITPAGSLAVRVAGQFARNRKLGKGHQNVLVFVKGDPTQACAACGEISVEFPESVIEQANAQDAEDAGNGDPVATLNALAALARQQQTSSSSSEAGQS